MFFPQEKKRERTSLMISSIIINTAKKLPQRMPFSSPNGPNIPAPFHLKSFPLSSEETSLEEGRVSGSRDKTRKQNIIDNRDE
jgi:hypothetical protein